MNPAVAFARLFARPEAKIVLQHLKTITTERVLGPDATDNELRFLEGQRALFKQMLSLVKQGQKEGENI